MNWRSEWASKTESYENARKQVTDFFIIRKGTYFLQESHIKQSDIVMLNNKEMDTETLGKYKPKKY